MKRMIIASALFLFSAAAVTAQPAYENGKDENRRIQNGVYSGQITKGEAARLRAEEGRLRADIYRYKRDGHLSPWERKDLEMKQRQLDRNIYLQKHDRQTRY